MADLKISGLIYLWRSSHVGEWSTKHFEGGVAVRSSLGSNDGCSSHGALLDVCSGDKVVNIVMTVIAASFVSRKQFVFAIVLIPASNWTSFELLIRVNESTGVLVVTETLGLAHRDECVVEEAIRVHLRRCWSGDLGVLLGDWVKV